MPEIMTRPIKVLVEVEFTIHGALGVTDAVERAMKHLQAKDGYRVPGDGKVIGVRADSGGRRWYQ